jgi:NADPH-dependent curcumin reductase CurA
MWGWQSHAVMPGESLQRADVSLAPLPAFLGVLGMPGLTAYFGMLEVGAPQEGETVFVSGAAGAVGSLAGQIAKLQGCRVAGSAGSRDKVDYLLGECAFDAAFNYKDYSPDQYPEALKSACPGGIDVYFDNVGGPLTDSVIMQLNEHARISICGQIDQYNDVEISLGPRLLSQFIAKRIRAEGFLVLDYYKRFEEGQRQLARWLADGRITYRETITEGIENTPAAFIGLFTGANTGKQLVHVSPGDI